MPILSKLVCDSGCLFSPCSESGRLVNGLKNDIINIIDIKYIAWGITKPVPMECLTDLIVIRSIGGDSYKKAGF